MTVDNVDDVRAKPTTAVPAEWDVGRSPGSLIVAWQHPESRLIAPVGLLEHGQGVGYRFRYLVRAVGLPGFQPFLSFPEWRDVYRSPRLFPLFTQRIMSPRRPDFSQFLRQLHLDPGATPWEQLARSEGRRTGDTVQVFPIPVVEDDGRTSCRFLVHGVRHVNGGALPPLSAGDRLTFRREPDNPKNPRAVLVCTDDGVSLGYVPDLLLEHLGTVESTGKPLSLSVEHVNDADAPPHLRLLVRLDGHGPPGYRPMTGAGWETFTD